MQHRRASTPTPGGATQPRQQRPHQQQQQGPHQQHQKPPPSQRPFQKAQPSSPARQRSHSAKQAGKRVDRRAGAATSPSGAVELTRAQQLEAKAARDAVVAGMAKSAPQAAKKLVESISLDLDVETARQLMLSKKGLAALPSSLGLLCRQLRKLELANNDLTDLSPLATLDHLSNLNVAHNARLALLKGLRGTCLSVLNISFCAVESLEGLEHTALTLRTLIANDNRLHLCAPLLGDEASPEAAESREHLPEPLRSRARAGGPQSAVGLRNYAIIATFQQCETVVLSRNTRLCESFPSWSAEEQAAACGALPSRGGADAAAGLDGDDSGAEDSASVCSSPSDADGETRGATSRRAAHAKLVKETKSAAAARELAEDAPEMAAYKQRRQAVALAHPLRVFERLPRLKKLSLSGCALHSLPARWFLPMVTELRLAQNALVSLQPDGVILRSVHILDVSHNLFTSVSSLRRCRFLEQLNIRGNPLLEEGAAQDQAAGLSVATADADATEKTGDAAEGAEEKRPSASAAVPVTVQQRVLRLLPHVKLVDGQPLMTPEQLRAVYKRRRNASTDAESSPKAVEGGADGAAGAAETQPGSASAAQTPATSGASRTAQPTAKPRKAPRVDPAAIAAEAEEKDVVIEAPSSVVKAAHAPIVRRERVLLRLAPAAAASRKSGSSVGKPGVSAPAVYGKAAVAKLLDQNRQTSAW